MRILTVEIRSGGLGGIACIESGFSLLTHKMGIIVETTTETCGEDFIRQCMWKGYCQTCPFSEGLKLQAGHQPGNEPGTLLFTLVSVFSGLISVHPFKTYGHGPTLRICGVT